jgi:hypothetical protein
LAEEGLGFGVWLGNRLEICSKGLETGRERGGRRGLTSFEFVQGAAEPVHAAESVVVDGAEGSGADFEGAAVDGFGFFVWRESVCVLYGRVVVTCISFACRGQWPVCTCS